MSKNKTLLFVFLAVLSLLASNTSSIHAQTNSPYSRYGLGSLKDQITGPSKGMGGVGYGLYTSQSANPMNPASYAQVDSLTFIYDIGVNFTHTTYKEGANRAAKDGGGLEYITALFPVSKKIGISFGLLPFSSTGYLMGSSHQVGTSNTYYNIQHDGSGGLSQAYVGMGYKLPIKGLTAGVNVSYLFGNIKQTNATSYITGGSNLTSQYTKLNVTTARIDIGVQYRMDLSDINTLTLGAVYTPKMNGTGKLNRTEYIVDQSGNLLNQDTLFNGVVATGTPHMLGAGFVLNHKRKLLLGFDVKYEHWKGARFTNELLDGLNSSNRFNNRWKFAAGVEYRVAQYSRNYLQKIKFRGGLNYSNSYVNVQVGNQVKGFNEYGATLGFGLPIVDREELGGRTSYININFEYKYLSPELSSMVKERYFGISLNMNLNELWFYQRKIR